ncbi:MAG: hypothetical protein SRB2_02140 [Desulfobacteraceae bacterium Eth-SRB2]|nr:MAG: hypothetical protein SRB2_02140 [Desulfobacteraceae bacterium Eth-SRB2]
MVGVAGTAAMGAFVKKYLETADAIGKASDVIGISTSALQEYRHGLGWPGLTLRLWIIRLKRFPNVWARREMRPAPWLLS